VGDLLPLGLVWIRGKHRKIEGFSSGGKEERLPVWNEGIGNYRSGGKAPRPVLLEETKNELRTQGKLSCSAHALNELTQHQLITATLQ
jgi:hypothetical protein